jgi:hypothetical protein
MKRVYRHDSMAEVGLIRGLLEQSGIACLTKNEQLSGALGEIPFPECQPELWVLEDADAARAEKIIARHLDDVEGAEDWICRQCGERNEGQFGICWQCGTPHPED